MDITEVNYDLKAKEVRRLKSSHVSNIDNRGGIEREIEGFAMWKLGFNC